MQPIPHTEGQLLRQCLILVSLLKSPLSKTDGIISKSSAVSLPTFNCVFADTSATGGFDTNLGTIKPYTCSPTTSGMDATTGVFTVAIAGQYRLTFMSRMKRTEKKVVAQMYNGANIIGRSTAQVMKIQNVNL